MRALFVVVAVVAFATWFGSRRADRRSTTVTERRAVERPATAGAAAWETADDPVDALCRLGYDAGPIVLALAHSDDPERRKLAERALRDLVHLSPPSPEVAEATLHLFRSGVPFMTEWGFLGKAVVPELLAMARSDDAGLARRARAALRDTGLNALPALRELLRGGVRDEWVVEAVARWREDVDLPLLLPLAEAGSVHALRGIAAIAPDAPAVHAALDRALADESMQSDAALVLGGLDRLSPPAVAVLVRDRASEDARAVLMRAGELLRPHAAELAADGSVGSAMLLWVAGIERTAARVRILDRAQDDLVAANACRELVRAGPECLPLLDDLVPLAGHAFHDFDRSVADVPVLLRLLAHAPTARRAATQLAWHGRGSVDAAHALARAALDPSNAARPTAVWSLTEVGVHDELTLRALESGVRDPRLRVRVLLGSDRLGPGAAALVPALLELDDAPGDALRLLARIGLATPDVLRFVARHFATEPLLAAMAAGEFGREAAPLLPHVEAYARADDDAVALAASWAVWRISGDDAPLLDRLRTAQRRETLQWFLGVEAPASIGPYLREALHDGTHLDRGRTLRLAGKLGAGAASFLPDLRALAGDDTEHESLRRFARDAIDAIEGNR